MEVPEPEGNRVLRARFELYVIDPKPSDLVMDRLKAG